ncbi:MAG: helix-turn-helix domain-containing protein [Deltaproteobacteria bacterium]|nr:helix-turn-helix domain-containing protein [Deltaproteobacteria bacterium]
MKSSRALPALPVAMTRALRKLGQDLSAARRRRRLTMALVAQRALISRATLSRVERGDPGVSMGIYATVLFVYGLGDRIGALADLGADPVGRALELESLPKRVRMPRKRPLEPAP